MSRSVTLKKAACAKDEVAFVVTGKAVLAAGIGLYLIGMVIMLVGLIRVSGEVQPPRPDRARTQKTLLHDALHARP